MMLTCLFSCHVRHFCRHGAGCRWAQSLWLRQGHSEAISLLAGAVCWVRSSITKLERCGRRWADHSLRKDDLWALHRGTAEMRACGFQEVHTAKSLKLASTVQHEPCTMEVISSFFLGPTFRFVPSGLSHQIYHYLIADIIQFSTDKQKFPIRAADLRQHHTGLWDPLSHLFVTSDAKPYNSSWSVPVRDLLKQHRWPANVISCWQGNSHLGQYGFNLQNAHITH